MKSAEYFILWSGGKDSYLSYKKALSRGFKITHALSYVEARSKRLIGCFVREEVVREQVAHLGLEFVPVYGSKRKGNFGQRLSETVKKINPAGGVFGDIYQREHRNFLEVLCSKLGIRAIFPLWQMDERVLIAQVMEVSSPMVVCRRVWRVPRRFLGGRVNEELVNFLSNKGMSISGEEGEYQSFVDVCEDFEMKVKVEKTFRRSRYECADLKVEGDR